MNLFKKFIASQRLSFWLIFLSICMFIGYTLSQRQTAQEKFLLGCLQGDTQPSIEQCQCLTAYVFEHLGATLALNAMEPHRIRSKSDLEKIQSVLHAGTQHCNW
ncbi:hypothetical protein [Chrysiogenes arsenatis]|uniref:hypothetical protein n=1 Tax=Chrysiogenes arsenatis TaxID=309797 RepID=UPI000415661D|nr:hypothetical protein [Chrysiogenes arsenatis]